MGQAEKATVNMSKLNSTRSGCKDVFHAFLVKNAEYDGHIEIPKIKASHDIPEKNNTVFQGSELD